MNVFKVGEGMLTLEVVFETNGEMVSWNSCGNKLAIATEDHDHVSDGSKIVIFKYTSDNNKSD